VPGGHQPLPSGQPRARRKFRGPLIGLGVLVLVAAVAAALIVLIGRDDPESGPVIAQYEYRFTRPDGWTQTGGDPSLLRTEIKPVGDQQGADLVLVEEKRLTFDSTADRSRAVDKLRADFTAGGERFSGFDDGASFAGRDVVYYRETLDAEQATVDWYVLFQGDAQVSVGCQHTESGRDTVREACDVVVRSMVVGG
nr:type VII secretion-associated protein [Actinomycetota bacterium]